MRLTAAHGRLANGPAMAALSPDEERCRRELRAAGFDLEELAESDRRLLRLLAAFDLRLELQALPDAPVWIAALVCHADPAGRGEVCVGKGWQPAQAVYGCLGEFAEYRSWLARGNEPVIRKKGDPLAWCRLEDLMGGEPVLAPAALCYGRAPATWSGDTGALVGDSNGCAAGPDHGHATLAALLEVIERDATGIWWYAGCRRPALTLEPGTAPRLAAALAERQRHPRPAWLLDLTTDLGLPVVAAVSLTREGRLPALGFGAGLAAHEAAESAFLELCQAELNLALCLRRWQGQDEEELPPPQRELRAWLERAAGLPWLRPAGCRPATGPIEAPTDAMAACLDRLRAAGLRAYGLDLTRDDVGVPAVKVVAPGACPIKPNFAAARLIEVPVALGWQAPGFGREDLNRLPLLV